MDSTLYSYAIVAQPIHEGSRYMWQKTGKYKKLIDAQKALVDFNKDAVVTKSYKIVPYFKGYWWVDVEIEKMEYKKANIQLWQFLHSKGLADEARDYIKPKVKA